MSYVGPARYEYYGKTIHLRLRRLKDLDQVLKLNEVFWLATTAPVGDYLLPPEFLNRLDTDGDGRVRVEPLLHWGQQRLLQSAGTSRHAIHTCEHGEEQ